MDKRKDQLIREVVKICKDKTRYWPDTGFDLHFDRWDDIEKEGLIKGKRVIDIGCGESVNLLPRVMNMGASGYVGVEPSRYESATDYLEHYLKNNLQWGKKAKVVKKDGLEFLATQPSNSGIVVSFGVFRGDQHQNIPHEIQMKYMQLFCEEVARITPAGSITIHYPEFEYSKILEAVGFKPYMRSGEKDIELFRSAGYEGDARDAEAYAHTSVWIKK